MKFNKFKTLTAAIAALGLLLMAPPSRADIYTAAGGTFTNTALSSTSGPFYGRTTTNLTTLTATESVLTVDSDPIPIRQGWGVALMPSFTATNASGSARVTNVFQVGIKANGVTNWSTTYPVTIVSTLSGTTVTLDYTNVPPVILNNASYLRWHTVGVSAQSGQTNLVTIGNLIWSQSQWAP